METIEDINEKIIKITNTIGDNYPELMNYLNEMPITIPNEANPEITIKNLTNYYESLVTIFRNYISKQQLNYTSQKTPTGNL